MSTLLTDIEAFLTTHHMKPTRFGEDALKDRHFVRQLRKGRRVWPETEAKARHFMVTYRPEGAPELAKAS
jgi:hypothetical protein